MYLSKVHLENWRSYEDATFNFKKPNGRKPLILIGAMNGHGKTSFLIALYLGLFGKFGLRYCEGFTQDPENNPFYRKAIQLFRRNSANADQPSLVEMVFSPTLQDTDFQEVRIVRRWFFDSSNRPKLGEAFETVEIYRDDRPIKVQDLEYAHDKIEKLLFPAHIMPAFLFDGEQAQMLINNSGAPGIKKAVEVMFGTKIIDDVHAQIEQYLNICHQKLGGKKQASFKEQELSSKTSERQRINAQLTELQKKHIEKEKEKEEIENSRKEAMERLTMLGGQKALDVKKLGEELLMQKQNKSTAEKNLTDTVRHLGLALSLTRLGTPIENRLKSEEIREKWERLRESTMERAEQVIAVAVPEPPSSDELLGNLSQEIRDRVKDRFKRALQQIYNPPPNGCADSYLCGHVKGEQRHVVFDLLCQVRAQNASDIRQKAKKLKEAREIYEETIIRNERLTNLPDEVNELANQLDSFHSQIDEAIRRLNSIENEIKKLKGDLHNLNSEIGKLQEEIASMEPQQKRIAVAERIHRVLTELSDKLRPIALNHLEELVTHHFLLIADKRFKGRIKFPKDAAPIFEFQTGKSQAIDIMSGFERRSFGIAFSLALAEITQKRVPLIIDTPLGNADSKYRPRLLQALTDVALDQIIILTHDQEVNGELLSSIDQKVSQKYLVIYSDESNASSVFENSFFGEQK